MKKLLLFAFAVFAFAACTQNDVEELSANREDVPEVLTIGFEGDDTRIQLAAGKTVWTKDDLVSVFYFSNANQKWQYQGETGERVGNLLRVADATATEAMHCTVVVYPYNENYYINTETYNIEATLPAVQHYAEESYGVGENLMVSQSEFSHFSLKSVCGWLKIQLTGNGERVQSITLRGNNEEQLAGLIYVDTATAESTLASEDGDSSDNNAGGNLVFNDAIVTELTLDCGEGVELSAEAKSFYIAVPPQTFEKGFTIDVECEDYEPMTISTENRITIQRNTIQPMASIVFEGEEVIPYNEIRYTATAKVKMDWTFYTFGANIVSHEWDSESGEGVIIFDADVTTIGNIAFQNCDSLTSVTIPDSVTTIGNSAFNYCDSLTSVTIGDSVTTIGEWAFRYCENLTSVTIGDSVTTIGKRAFYYCRSLTSITIPDSVTTIGERAFSYCDSLTEFNGKFASENGRCLIVDGTLNSFAPAGLTSYTIPDSVTTIGGYAFAYCSSLTNITIPDSVTTIGNYAFYNCSSLISVYCEATTPPSLGGSYVFYDNAYDRKFYVPAESVEAYESASYWSDYADAIVAYDFENGVVVEPGNKIHYTATAKVEAYSSYPWSFDTFGANILSHDFNEESGEGVITFDADVTTIGEWAFYYCKSLTSITIPDSVTTIGDDAFYRCSSLTSVTILDSVTTIGKKAFYDCDNLTSVTIGDSVTTIGEEAFYDCDSLTSVTIGDSVTTIGVAAFDDCGSLTSVTIGNSVTTIGVAAFDSCKSLTSITIPDSVTTIGKKAFYYCRSLTSVTIPDSVTTIGVAAFAYCTNLVEFNGKFASEDGRCLIVDGTLNSFAPAGLTSYTIPDSVTTIGEYAFRACSSLTSVTIPDSVTTIGEEAFYYCKSLTSVTIGDSVTTIGDSAFFYCSSLTSITIPDSVTTIGDYAFDDCYSLTSVTIGDSVTTIGEYAFYGCSSLTSVTIPDSVTTIGDEAFYNCKSLASLYCKATTPPSLDGSYVFNYNASGRKIYVPAASVEAYKTAAGWSTYADTIVGYDFENGVVVEPEVSINSVIRYTATAKVEAYSSYPWSFDTFGANILSHDFNEESGEGVITFDADVTTIGESAFANCRSLTSVTIGDSVTTIGDSAFEDCDSLTSITIGDSVTTIGDSAFAWCSSLTSVTIGDSVTTIGEKAFFNCSSLTSVTIPDSVTTIGNYAFSSYYSSLTSVTIGNSVTTIGNYAFEDCRITSVTIPDSVTTIGMAAFGSCYSLTSVTIPDSVTTIGMSAFINCNCLTSVTIPDSVTTIGERAFYECNSLTSVYCEATTPPSLGGSEIFDNYILGPTIYVPAASVEAYKTAEYWSKYASYIAGYDFEKGEVVVPEAKPANNEIWYTTSYNTNPYSSKPFDVEIISNTYDSENERWVIKLAGEVTKINESAFEVLGKFMTSITIPESVTEIGICAFNNCFELKAIDIPKNVTSIGDWAFHYCTSFTSVTIPNSVETIGDYAFAYCKELAEFKGKFAADNGRCLIVNGDLNAYAIGCNTAHYTIPDGVVSLGERSFAGAVKLTEVVIPSSVNEVCSQAFQDCSSLASLYCESQLPPTFSRDALYGVASNLRIYVPVASVEAYKAATGWSTYADAIVGYDFENGVVVE